MTKKTLLITTSALAFTLLTGCGGGGGGSDTSASAAQASNTAVTAYYNAFVPLQDNPTTFECDTSDTKTGMFAIESYFDTKTECETYAQSWISDYNRNDAPQTAEQQEGLDYLNSLRRGVGLPEFKHNAKLEQATFNHENYLGDVMATYNTNMGHYEDNASYPSDYYTGDSGTDRAKHAGYKGYFAGDVISYEIDATAKESIDTLITAIYHRQAMFWSFTNEIGIGGVERKFGYEAQPHLMGVKMERETFLKAISPILAVYPFDGQTGVNTTFISESPDPLPDTSDWTGNPISVSFNDYYVEEVTMLSFKLFNEDTGEEITDTRLLDKDTDPNGRFGELDFALFPMDVLENNTTYRVEIDYVQNGEEKIKEWRFTTR